MTTAEEKEILSLLCKVHELEIDKVSFREAIVSVKHVLRKPSVKTCFREAIIGVKHYFCEKKFTNGQCFSKYFSGGDEKRGLAQESRSQAKRSPDPQVKYNP